VTSECVYFGQVRTKEGEDHSHGYRSLREKGPVDFAMSAQQAFRSDTHEPDDAWSLRNAALNGGRRLRLPT
jgi:hypothetical protein